jgi:hypothetical protein
MSIQEHCMMEIEQLRKYSTDNYTKMGKRNTDETSTNKTNYVTFSASSGPRISWKF